MNSRSTPHSSYVVHPPPQGSSVDHQNISSSPSNNRSLVTNLCEPLPSFDTILNSSSLLSRTQKLTSKDSISSHQSITKQTLIMLPSTIKSVTTTQMPSTSTNSSTMIFPKTTSNSNSIEKRPINTNDDCLYVRYERESHTINTDPFRFSYVIDEHSPSLHKRLRYVSINDL